MSIALKHRFSPDRVVGRMFQNARGGWVKVGQAEALMSAAAEARAILTEERECLHYSFRQPNGAVTEPSAKKSLARFDRALAALDESIAGLES